MKETDEAKTGIRSGSAIMVVLHSPREKSWGILDELTSAGVFMRGLDLNSFDDWLHASPYFAFMSRRWQMKNEKCDMENVSFNGLSVCNQRAVKQ